MTESDKVKQVWDKLSTYYEDLAKMKGVSDTGVVGLRSVDIDLSDREFAILLYSINQLRNVENSLLSNVGRLTRYGAPFRLAGGGRVKRTLMYNNEKFNQRTIKSEFSKIIDFMTRVATAANSTKCAKQKKERLRDRPKRINNVLDYPSLFLDRDGVNMATFFKTILDPGMDFLPGEVNVDGIPGTILGLSPPHGNLRNIRYFHDTLRLPEGVAVLNSITAANLVSIFASVNNLRVNRFTTQLDGDSDAVELLRATFGEDFIDAIIGASSLPRGVIGVGDLRANARPYKTGYLRDDATAIVGRTIYHNLRDNIYLSDKGKAVVVIGGKIYKEDNIRSPGGGSRLNPEGVNRISYTRGGEDEIFVSGVRYTLDPDEMIGASAGVYVNPRAPRGATKYYMDADGVLHTSKDLIKVRSLLQELRLEVARRGPRITERAIADGRIPAATLNNTAGGEGLLGTFGITIGELADLSKVGQHLPRDSANGQEFLRLTKQLALEKAESQKEAEMTRKQSPTSIRRTINRKPMVDFAPLAQFADRLTGNARTAVEIYIVTNYARAATSNILDSTNRGQ